MSMLNTAIHHLHASQLNTYTEISQPVTIEIYR